MKKKIYVYKGSLQIIQLALGNIYYKKSIEKQDISQKQ